MPALHFEGKVVSVTGSAAGIGFATACYLYDQGATLALSDCNAKTLNGLAKVLSVKPHKAGQQFITALVDVSNASEVEAWVSKIISTFGRLDCAANVAGGGDGSHCKIADKTTEDFNTAIDINLRGIFNCMRAQLPRMNTGSSIVNVSSGAGIVGQPGVGLYSAAKAGINMLTATAAKEYGPSGIRINAVAPGLTLTPSLLGAGIAFLEPTINATPLGRGAEPIEIAQPIAFLLGDQASFITGVVLRIDGGCAAIGH